MPRFDMECLSCNKVYTLTYAFSEFDEIEKQRCISCGGNLKRIYKGNSPEVFIPAQFGTTKKGFI